MFSLETVIRDSNSLFDQLVWSWRKQVSMLY